jgi:UDP-N-acetyl-D-glucosamine dehydrogenase
MIAARSLALRGDIPSVASTPDLQPMPSPTPRTQSASPEPVNAPNQAASDYAAHLTQHIDGRTARIGVIGLGYVGLPLAVALAEQGFPVTGMDVNPDKVARMRAGRSPIEDIPDAQLAAVLSNGRLRLTTEPDSLIECAAHFVCVPTPFDRHKTPDLSYVISAAEQLAAHLAPGALVVLQSTTYPGTTSEVFLPRLERDGRRVGQDFFLAFSPERIDPGVPEHTVLNTPKVVGGVTPTCGALAEALLGTLGTAVHRVSSPAVAEMTKLLENTFRNVNIALVNELALLCERMGLDIWEVIDAAATKPFGFMPFRPGAGVGGHCIPIDPYYLSWKAREYDFPTRFIELAGDVNGRMPHHVAELVTEALGRHDLAVAGARVLVLGVAFKPNVDDARHSPAERVIALLRARGANVAYHDPHVTHFEVGGDVFLSERQVVPRVALDEQVLEFADAVVILARHDAVDYARVCTHARLVIDTSNATRGIDLHPGNLKADILRLGSPHADQIKQHSAATPSQQGASPWPSSNASASPSATGPHARS